MTATTLINLVKVECVIFPPGGVMVTSILQNHNDKGVSLLLWTYDGFIREELWAKSVVFSCHKAEQKVVEPPAHHFLCFTCTKGQSL